MTTCLKALKSIPAPNNVRNLSLMFNRKPVVSVLQLHGMIAASSGGMGGKKKLNIDMLDKRIEKAFKPKRLEQVLLSVNSPGGSAVQSELIAEQIMRKAQEKKVPVYSFVEDMAASGGYWLALAGEKIYISKSSVVGSIGVISASFGLDKLISKWGVERRVHTAGKNKSLFDPFAPEKEEDIKILKGVLDAVHVNFKNHVKSQRGSRLNADDETLFNGAFWVGQTAVDLGLVDGLGTVKGHIAEQFGPDKVKVVTVKRNASPLEGLMASAQQESLKEMLLHAAQYERLSLR